MRNLEDLYNELEEIRKEMDWYNSRKLTYYSGLYAEEKNKLGRRKDNIYININQIKQFKWKKKKE